MNYLPKNRQKSHYSKRIFLLVVLFLAGGLVFTLLDGVLVSALSPIWQVENAGTRVVKNAFENWHSRQALIRENTTLKEKLASAEVELSALYASQGQERTLLELLGRAVPQAGVVASILTYPPQSSYDILVIDAGSRDQVTAGARVFLPEGPELGVVSEVFPSSAKVKLFSTDKEKTNAVLERHNVPVILDGVGAGNFKIIMPRDTEVEIGDRILSAHLAPSLLAVVEDIKVEPTDAFKEVLAKSPVNIFNIRLVLIRP